MVDVKDFKRAGELEIDYQTELSYLYYLSSSVIIFFLGSLPFRHNHLNPACISSWWLSSIWDTIFSFGMHSFSCHRKCLFCYALCFYPMFYFTSFLFLLHLIFTFCCLLKALRACNFPLASLPTHLDLKAFVYFCSFALCYVLVYANLVFL